MQAFRLCTSPQWIRTILKYVNKYRLSALIGAVAQGVQSPALWLVEGQQYDP